MEGGGESIRESRMAENVGFGGMDLEHFVVEADLLAGVELQLLGGEGEIQVRLGWKGG